MWQWDCSQTLPFRNLNAADCVFGGPWAEAKTRGLIWGDSHAQHMAPLIQTATRDLPDSFLLYLPCPPMFGGKLQRDPSRAPAHYAELCTGVREQGIRLLRDHPDIDLVVLSARRNRSSSCVCYAQAPPGLQTMVHIRAPCSSRIPFTDPGSA
jgi:hypothetical protein